VTNFIKRLSWLCLLITFTLTTTTAHDDSDGKREPWTDPAPTPPWDFRHGKTAKTQDVKPAATAIGPIIGNRSSKFYHLPNNPDYSKVSERNRVPFKTEAKAQAAKYRKARNCSQ